MIAYEWGAGTPAPAGVTADTVASDCDARGDWSPDGLLEASEKKRHPLHNALWVSKGDDAWAREARRAYCRRIIGGIVVCTVVGGKTIENRVVEFIKTAENGGVWAKVEDIVSDPDLLDAHMAALESMMQQATNKIARFRQLIRARGKQAAA